MIDSPSMIDKLLIGTIKSNIYLIQRTIDYMACICLYFSGPENCYQAPDADPIRALVFGL